MISLESEYKLPEKMNKDVSYKSVFFANKDNELISTFYHRVAQSCTEYYKEYEKVKSQDDFNEY